MANNIVVQRVVMGLSGIALILGCFGCYGVRPSSGGGQTAKTSRTPDPSSIAVPDGYRMEVVAAGLTFPTGVTFDSSGTPYVVESGYSYGEKWTTPRLLKVGPGGVSAIATGGRNGPWNGVTFHNGNFYVAEGGVLEGGRILKIGADGTITRLVEGLPSFGDHHTDGPVMGTDGWLYFSQGTASNSGVIGEDNAKFGWLKRHPDFCDIPGADVTLTGENFKSKDPLHPGKNAETGAYLPFGTPSTKGQVVKGSVKCSGSVLRVRPEGGDVELVAWGLRNPFGLAVDPKGEIYVTENGFDDRGSRPVWGTTDFLWKVQKGAWYGWPDFVGGEAITNRLFHPPGKHNLRFVLANHPGVPPKPVANFGVHASADGLDFSRSAEFGHVGNAFVALFGDEAPSTGKVLHPVGFKIVRVDTSNGVIYDFAVNRTAENGPGTKVGGNGFERPVAARFDPSGKSLYIVDFGVLNQDKSGAKAREGTGVLWKITRTK